MTNTKEHAFPSAKKGNPNVCPVNIIPRNDPLWVVFCQKKRTTRKPFAAGLRRGGISGGCRQSLRGSVLRGSVLRGSVLRGSILRESILRESILLRADAQLH
ncbi:MAG: pentapeptide repeat-containing protein [Clostridia bacterium]|nr:pentapeptide repeat-containing protein [Clostridia bacterium]